MGVYCGPMSRWLEDRAERASRLGLCPLDGASDTVDGISRSGAGGPSVGGRGRSAASTTARWQVDLAGGVAVDALKDIEQTVVGVDVVRTAMRLCRVATASAPTSLQQKSQFFLLCRARNNHGAGGRRDASNGMAGSVCGICVTKAKSYAGERSPTPYGSLDDMRSAVENVLGSILALLPRARNSGLVLAIRSSWRDDLLSECAAICIVGQSFHLNASHKGDAD